MLDKPSEARAVTRLDSFVLECGTADGDVEVHPLVDPNVVRVAWYSQLV